MSSDQNYEIDMGKLIWELLPGIYRTKDKPPQDGDLKIFISAFGDLLDSLHQLLEKCLKDISPTSCQNWLIPYFADLLDVHLISPHIEGQRQEVAKAISWRQGKGTLEVVRQITEDIGRIQNKVVIHEGFKRVATTVRVNMPPFTRSSIAFRPATLIKDIDQITAEKLGIVYSPKRDLTIGDLRLLDPNLKAFEEEANFIPISLLKDIKTRVKNILAFKLEPKWNVIAGWSLEKVNGLIVEGSIGRGSIGRGPIGRGPMRKGKIGKGKIVKGPIKEQADKEKNIISLTGQSSDEVNKLKEDLELVLKSFKTDKLDEITLYDFALPNWQSPSRAARWPEMPMGTVDFRIASRGKRVNRNTHFTCETDFDENEIDTETKEKKKNLVTWQQANTHGVPCFPNSYQDQSVRTVDMRSSDWRIGHYHPKRIILYTPIPNGFFVKEPTNVKEPTKIKWEDIKEEVKKIEDIAKPFDQWEDIGEGRKRFVRKFNKTNPELRDKTNQGLRDDGTNPKLSDGSDPKLSDGTDPKHRDETNPKHSKGNDSKLKFEFIEEVQLDNKKKPIAHRTTIRRNKDIFPENELPVIEGIISLENSLENDLTIRRIYCFEKIVINDALNTQNAFLELHETAVNKINVIFNNSELFNDIDSHNTPFLSAKDSLLNDEIDVSFEGDNDITALCRFEYCTLFSNVIVICRKLQASDSILLGKIQSEQGGELRYCSLKPDLLNDSWVVHKKTLTFHKPLFYQYRDLNPRGGKETLHSGEPGCGILHPATNNSICCCDSNPQEGKEELAFGEPGCGVLHPATHNSIRFGAEDGGEMGAYHHRHYTLCEEAIVDKLKEFLPVGMKPALVQGKYWHAPPKGDS